MVTGAGMNEVMRATAVKGNIVNIGRLGGTSGSFDFDLHSLRRISFHGVTFRTRGLDEIRAIVQAVEDVLWPFVEQSELALPIDRSFSLTDAAHAHSFMATNQHFGKLVLIP
jgi:NADPH2:quinone reductase